MLYHPMNTFCFLNVNNDIMAYIRPPQHKASSGVKVSVGGACMLRKQSECSSLKETNQNIQSTPI